MKLAILALLFILTSTQGWASVKAYFNHNQNKEYLDPYRGLVRPGDNLEQVIIDEVNKAKKSIFIAVQELRLPLLAQALVKKKAQGVDVRVILENDYNFTVLGSRNQTQDHHDAVRFTDLRALVDINSDGKITKEELEARDAVYMLRSAKIPVMDDTMDDSSGSGLMHHKFVVVDGSTTIVSTANFTLSCIHGDYRTPSSRGNPNSMTVVKSVALAKIFLEEFSQMWGDGKVGNFGQNKTYRGPQTINIRGTEITVQFSPTSATQNWQGSVNGLTSSILEKSKKSIKAALFVFSDQSLANVMEQRHLNGVKIGVLIEPKFAFREYSELLDMLGLQMLNGKCAYEPNNRPWKKKAQEVGMAVLPGGDILHHKFAVVDRKIVIMGSQNWTDAANGTNDETLMVIQDKTISDQYTQEYDRVLASSQLGVSPKVMGEIAAKEEKCGSSRLQRQD
jgi:phosphatidylserine/phosphatidylglycerophosphate/cardiolipin synthase-like enzyme